MAFSSRFFGVRPFTGWIPGALLVAASMVSPGSPPSSVASARQPGRSATAKPSIRNPQHQVDLLNMFGMLIRRCTIDAIAAYKFSNWNYLYLWLVQPSETRAELPAALQHVSS